MGIQHYFIDKIIKTSLKKANRSKADTVLSNISSIIIFVDEQSAFDQKEFRNLKSKMNLGDAHFNILTYKEKKTSYNEFKGTIFEKNSINWRGVIKSDTIKEVINQPYDLLIDYTQADNQIKQLIVAKINASFKVGYSNNNEKYYNLIVAVNPNEIDKFNKEIVRYLKILKLI